MADIPTFDRVPLNRTNKGLFQIRFQNFLPLKLIKSYLKKDAKLANFEPKYNIRELNVD